jgi:transcriptional regulator with XRE-family HTH domain
MDLRELRNIRLRRGLSQADLSAITGVAEYTISEIEAGKRPNPRPSTLRKLAQGLGVEVADLYGESAYPLGEAPPSAEQRSFNHLLEEERREAIYQPWLEFADRYADRWERRIQTGAFDIGSVNEFLTILDELLPILNKLNADEQRELPQQPFSHGVPAAWTGRAIHRLLGLFDPMIEAGVHQFENSDLEQFRQKRAELGRQFKETGAA